MPDRFGLERDPLFVRGEKVESLAEDRLCAMQKANERLSFGLPEATDFF